MKVYFFLAICSIALCIACHTRFQEGVDIDAREPGGVCPAHNAPLQDDMIRITYGLVKLTKEERDAHQDLFPRARSDYNQGCVVGESKWARVSFCPECRKAEAAWKDDQKRIAAPIEAHLEQVRQLIHGDPRFSALHPYLQQKGGLRVGIEGSVKTESDLADFRQLVEETNPPKPVYWKVRITSDESKTDVEKLEGRWLISESISKAQTDVGKEKGLEANTLVDIHGYRMILTHLTTDKAIGVELRFTYELNANKNPKQMNLEVLEGKNEGKRLQGIYSLEGDTLKIAMAMTPDEKRPTSFLPKEEPIGWHLVLERLKP
jgi:uncharacterized protein (TIGR03067 family)